MVAQLTKSRSAMTCTASGPACFPRESREYGRRGGEPGAFS